jgi:hypothetical protein
MSPKAQTHSFLKALIIMALLIIIFTLFIIRTVDVFKGKTSKEICKADVYGKAAMGIKPLKFVEKATELIDSRHEIVSDIDCPTQEVVIKEKLSTDSGQTKAKAQIARAMYDCWDEFGEGKYELFESKPGTEVYCAICHHITFTDNNTEITGFVNYLEENTIPTSTEVSYYEYLTGFQSNENLEIFKQDMESFMQSHNAKEIVTSSDYAVTFFYFKQGYIDKLRGGVIGAVSGAGGAAGVGIASIFVAIPGPGWIGLGLLVIGTGIGIAAGSDKSADWNSGVMLIPLQSEQLSSLGCSYLPAKQDAKE